MVRSSFNNTKLGLKVDSVLLWKKTFRYLEDLKVHFSRLKGSHMHDSGVFMVLTWEEKIKKSKTVRDKMLNKPPHRRKPKSPLPSDPKSVADATPFLPPLA